MDPQAALGRARAERAYLSAFIAGQAQVACIGAGEGNRTLVFSLEGCCSTIELHPRRSYIINIGAALNGKKRELGFAQLFFGPLTNENLLRWGAKNAWHGACMRVSNQAPTTGKLSAAGRLGVGSADSRAQNACSNRLDGGV